SPRTPAAAPPPPWPLTHRTASPPSTRGSSLAQGVASATPCVASGLGYLAGMTAVVAVACGVLGLAVGSFLNVVVYRVPRKESVVRPRSHCPNCGTQLADKDNVPVVSWLALRGRCRTCGEPISVRYPLVELATAALFVAAGLRFGADWALPAFLLLFASLLAISLIDLEHYIIPNRIVYPTLFGGAALLVVAAAGDGDWKALERAVIG